LKIEKTLTSVVLVDSKMCIIPEVLEFANTLKIQGRSVNTIRSYLNDLKVFYEWLEIEDLKFYELKPEYIPSFIEYVDAKHVTGRVSPPTLDRYLAAISSFYRHFEVMGGVVVASPLVKVKGYKPEGNRGYLRHVRSWDKELTHFFKRKKRRKIDRKRLSDETIKKFYRTIDELWNHDEPLKKRNKLIFKILYETGMRIGELLHLRVNDFDYPDPFKKTGNIYLIERENEPSDRQLKTGERTIPVSSSLLSEIDDYVMYHRPYKDEVEYLFVSHDRANLGEPISRTAVEKWFRNVKEVSGVKEYHCTPHALRHTHGGNLTDMGVDLSIIAERLGHSLLATTAKYSKPSLETLTKQHERYLKSKEGGVI
jgi:integrase/recombinase XerD